MHKLFRWRKMFSRMNYSLFVCFISIFFFFLKTREKFGREKDLVLSISSSLPEVEDETQWFNVFCQRNRNDTINTSVFCSEFCQYFLFCALLCKDYYYANLKIYSKYGVDTWCIITCLIQVNESFVYYFQWLYATSH